MMWNDIFLQGDAGKLPFADQSVDLVFGSPPYQDCRTYGINAQRDCRTWIDWMLQVTREACRVSRGLVLWVVGGTTRQWCYQPGPEGLLYEWWRQGGQCWRPVYWGRTGIPGSGGKQWLRADVEYVLCFKGAPGPISWADNVACGQPPKWTGPQRNQWGGTKKSSGHRRKNGSTESFVRPSHVIAGEPKARLGRDSLKGSCLGFNPPLANPGNLLYIPVGGGMLGHKLAHLNEAPFGERLAEFFILGWCPPGGVVCDPFSGSGTTVAAAVKHGRRGIGLDVRLSQCRLGARRCRELQGEIF